MSNGCPMCLGIGRVVAVGGCEPVSILCPECAGLAITPASADDDLGAPLGVPAPASEPLDPEDVAAVAETWIPWDPDGAVRPRR